VSHRTKVNCRDRRSKKRCRKKIGNRNSARNTGHPAERNLTQNKAEFKRNENLSSKNLKFSLVHVGIKIDDNDYDDYGTIKIIMALKYGLYK